LKNHEGGGEKPNQTLRKQFAVREKAAIGNRCNITPAVTDFVLYIYIDVEEVLPRATPIVPPPPLRV
jgi:hypothetical protein